MSKCLGYIGLMQTQGQIIFNQPSLLKKSLTLPLTPENHQKLEEMIERSQRVLLKIYTIFPFDFFPDCLTIDENKINLVHHEFGSKNLHTVFIENISYVTVDTTPFAATLNITDSTSERFPVLMQVSWLKKDDAFRARKLIHALIAAKKAGIRLEDYEKESLIRELEQLGEAKEAE